ncbi:DUF2721 domain-containing protein, partial [Pseudoalteromonas citrea]
AVVLLLFTSHLYSIPVGITLSSCFIAAMMLIMGAFLALLAEILLATLTMRRGMIFKDLE